MDVKKLSEAAMATIPANTTGLLIMRVSPGISAEDNVAIVNEMGKAIKNANIRCVFVCLSANTDDPLDFTLQHLTDDGLRDLGFQRIYSEFT